MNTMGGTWLQPTQPRPGGSNNGKADRRQTMKIDAVPTWTSLLKPGTGMIRSSRRTLPDVQRTDQRNVSDWSRGPAPMQAR